jgi:ubiquinone/menaquinone biosynthesis C-methylase UbiE
LNYVKDAEKSALLLKPHRLRKIHQVMGDEIGYTLELGCGVGVYSNDFSNWVGLDISKTALVVATGKNKVQASALKLPFKKACFSKVMLFSLIEHCSNPESVLLEVIRVIETMGFIAVGSPSLIWNLLLSGETSSTKIKGSKVEQTFANGLLSVPVIKAILKHMLPICKELYYRLKDELLIALRREIPTLRSHYIEPDYNFIGQDYDATYAYDPVAVVNYLRSHGFKIIDLKPMPARILRLPTHDVEIILACKI